MPEPVQPDDSQEFHLGFTMAGAISAGCYTGGVMDYFFEIMDLWEQAKKDPTAIGLPADFDQHIPKHRVIVDVMGGASAGGMTTAMAALHAMRKKRNPVKDASRVGGIRKNIFYDSWVLLDDPDATPGARDKRETFEKLWDTSDLKGGKIKSLLNSSVIDDIAKRAFTPDDDMYHYDHLPPYFAKDFELLLSLASLRGVPLSVDFATPNRKGSRALDHPIHTTWEHYILAHFKASPTPIDNYEYLWLNPQETEAKRVMQLATISTGAFPIGLKFREFTMREFPRQYIQNEITRVVFRQFGELVKQEKEPVDKIHRIVMGSTACSEKDRLELLHLIAELPASKHRLSGKLSLFSLAQTEKSAIAELLHDIIDVIDFERVPPDFKFIAIDGGAINNEPYGEVLEVLRDRYDEEEPKKPNGSTETEDSSTTNSKENKKKDIPRKYAVIMIDPFPDRAETQSKYSEPEDLFTVAGPILGMLRNQVKVKRKEMLDGFSEQFMRGVIFPRKKIGDSKPEKWPIASESFNAFGGFLDKKFRHHDYFLGRNNARNFFQYFFSLEYDPANERVHPIHAGWTPEMIKILKVESPRGSGRYYLPIVPDMNLVLMSQQPGGIPDDHYKKYDVPEKPLYKSERLMAIRPHIQKRVNEILKLASEYDLQGNSKSTDLTPAEKRKLENLLKRYLGKNWIQRRLDDVGGWFANRIVDLGIWSKTPDLTDATIKYILTDLAEKDLLDLND